MVVMDCVWLTRAGLLLSGLAAVSFLPAIAGEEKLGSVRQLWKGCRRTFRRWLVQSSDPSRASTGLMLVCIPIIGVCLYLGKTEPKWIVLLIIGLLLEFWAISLVHAGLRARASDERGVRLANRTHAVTTLALLCLIALATLLHLYFTPDVVDSRYLRILLSKCVPAVLVIAAGSYQHRIVLRAERSHALGGMLDFWYRWFADPVSARPARCLWRLTISFATRAIDSATDLLIWSSRSRNIHILALLFFIIGVTLQLSATFLVQE